MKDEWLQSLLGRTYTLRDVINTDKCIQMYNCGVSTHHFLLGRIREDFVEETLVKLNLERHLGIS